MNSVLVTGGAGYIGSHMVQALTRSGYRVVVLDNLSEGHLTAAQGTELVQEDLSDRSILRALLLRHRPAAVCHFAASCRIDESVENPVLYYKNNVVGTLNLIEAAIEAGVPRFVFSSTAAVYGEPDSVPINEDHPTNPINPYGWSKLMGERMLADAAKAYQFRFVAFRYFNAAGADSNSKIGEDHRPESHLIPLAIRSAILEEEELVINGDDYDTPDGTCVRDYVHVMDLVDAHIRGIQYLTEEGESTTINLGTETGYSVKEIIESVKRVTGLEVPHRIGPRRPGDPATLVASNARAREILDWEPQRDLDEMIRSAYEFMRLRPDGYPIPVLDNFGQPQPERAEVE
jgi:UDP-glucose 4-epimerase